MPTPKYSLELNPRGFFEARWSEKTETGKYRSKRWSTGRKDRGEAEIAAKSFFDSLGQIAAAQTPAGAATVREICDAYLAAAETREVGPTQRYSLKAVCAFMGAMTPGEVMAETVALFVKHRKTIDGCVSGTIRRDLNAFTAALNWGVKNRKLSQAEFPIIDLPPDSAPRDVWLDEQQEAEFYALALADSDGSKRLTRVTRFVAVALDTAARTEAIEDLTWDRVDFKMGKIDFNVPGRRVTKKRRSVVPISDRLRPILERAFQERETPYVIDPGAIRKAWTTFVKATPYAHIGKHDLRRTWATLAARAGVDLFQIAGVLADDAETVYKHYAKHQPEHLRPAVNARFKSQAPVIVAAEKARAA